MEKKVLDFKQLVDSGTNIRREFTPTAVVSDNGPRPVGEFWDANKTVDVIVNGATIAFDTLKETEDKLNQIDRELANRYTKAETEARIGDMGTIVEDEEERPLTVKEYIDAQDSTKQDALVSGQNIKTIGGQSIIGSGDINVGDGFKHVFLTAEQYASLTQRDSDTIYFVWDGQAEGGSVLGTFPITLA